MFASSPASIFTMSTWDQMPLAGIVTFFAGSKGIVDRSKVGCCVAVKERNAGETVTGAVPWFTTEMSVAQNFRAPERVRKDGRVLGGGNHEGLERGRDHVEGNQRRCTARAVDAIADHRQADGAGSRGREHVRHLLAMLGRAVREVPGVAVGRGHVGRELRGGERDRPSRLDVVILAVQRRARDRVLRARRRRAGHARDDDRPGGLRRRAPARDRADHDVGRGRRVGVAVGRSRARARRGLEQRRLSGLPRVRVAAGAAGRVGREGERLVDRARRRAAERQAEPSAAATTDSDLEDWRSWQRCSGCPPLSPARCGTRSSHRCTAESLEPGTKFGRNWTSQSQE